MTRYLIIHREDTSSSRWIKAEAEAESPVGALLNAMSKEEIRLHEFIIYELDMAAGITRDELFHNGALDDILEE